jgi:hypothetical protein
MRNRVREDQLACAVDQPDAFVRGVDDAAVALFAAAQLARHGARRAVSAHLRGHQQIGQHRQQCAQADARDQDHACRVVAEALLEARQAAHLERPGVAGQAEVLLGLEARRLVTAGVGRGAEDQRVVVQRHAVVDAQLQAGRALAVQARHQVGNAERRPDPADQRGTARCHGVGGRTLGVERQQH